MKTATALAAISLFALVGYSAQQQQQVQQTAASIQPGLQAACNDALAVANIAGLVPGVGAIVPYINAGCATAEGITKLAADPTSTAWVGQLTGQVKAIAGAAGIKISERESIHEPSILISANLVGIKIKNVDFTKWPQGYRVTLTKNNATFDGAAL